MGGSPFFNDRIDMDRYYKYSSYLKNKYGEKVYKIPINLPLTCPNRDGSAGRGGCTFCGDIATGFESLSNTLSVKEQLEKNIKYIKEKYKANKFIAYFQNFTNTYMSLEEFKKYTEMACIENVVEISISTRPDCINDKYLDILKTLSIEYNINVSIELGMQSIKYETLKKINRGHYFSEFLDAALRIKKYGFEIGVHLILNLPWDTYEDIIETAKIMSILDVNSIKLHSLYILKNTEMGKQYLNDEFSIITEKEYIKRVIDFIRYTKKDICFQRFLGRAPEKDTLFCNWNKSWRKIQNEIEAELLNEDIYQGDFYNYRNGKAVNRFVEVENG